MLKTVRTQYLFEEIPTDGHSPMKFLCDDGNTYYCKYRTQFKKEELDCLVYELVCQALLKNLQIATPEVALAIVADKSYDEKKLISNRRYVHPGTICFASKEIEHAGLITGIQQLAGKRDLNEFPQPYDLLKIAMFDLWVDNMDRGRGVAENYNLLMESYVLTEDGKEHIRNRWVAFDHAFCFGGTERIRIFNPSMLPASSGKLIESSYYSAVKLYYQPSICEQVIENFISLCLNNIETIIQDVFKQLPSEWQTPMNLAERMLSFLSGPDRLMHVKQLTQHYTLKHH